MLARKIRLVGEVRLAFSHRTSAAAWTAQQRE
ncbi:MAG: hypothetical protein KatS3mg116_2913 [Elioraea sp.]|jgi:hypothetical protein|nr:MAG: hypothetical protein KatS3mg116_2913 [Elioraea sp.]